MIKNKYREKEEQNSEPYTCIKYGSAVSNFIVYDLIMCKIGFLFQVVQENNYFCQKYNLTGQSFTGNILRYCIYFTVRFTMRTDVLYYSIIINQHSVYT